MRQKDEREDVRGTWARTKLLGISRLGCSLFKFLHRCFGMQTTNRLGTWHAPDLDQVPRHRKNLWFGMGQVPQLEDERYLRQPTSPTDGWRESPHNFGIHPGSLACCL